MRLNNTYARLSNVTLVTTSDVLDSDILVFKYVTGTTKDTLTFTTEVIGSFKYIYIDAPDEDCFILVKYGLNTEFIRIGNPPIYVLLHYLDSNLTTIPFEQYNYNSDILSNGDMTDIGDGFYVIGTSNIERSFYNILGNLITLTLPDKYLATCDYANGSLELQRGVWQLVALPINGNVKEQFVDVLAASEGVPDTDLIEVCSAYPGHINKFLSYIPGFTLSTSEHNFSLFYDDNNNKEITAFWIKCKEWTHTTNNIIFTWNV